MSRAFGAEKQSMWVERERGGWERGERRKMGARDGGLPWAMLPSWVCLAPVWAQLPVGTNHGGLAALRGSWQPAHTHTSTHPHTHRHAYTPILHVHAWSHTHARSELHWGQLALLINFCWGEESEQLTDLIKSTHTRYCCYCCFANIPDTHTQTYPHSPTYRFIPSALLCIIIDTLEPATTKMKKKEETRTFGAEKIRREAITVMCPLPSLRTPVPLDFRKLQLDSSKAIKLSTDKNRRMFFLIPCSSSVFLSPYPPSVPLSALCLTHLWGWELSLISLTFLCSLSLSLIIRSTPPPPLYKCISMFGCVSPFTRLLSL